jgi:hypothetical protein
MGPMRLVPAGTVVSCGSCWIRSGGTGQAGVVVKIVSGSSQIGLNTEYKDDVGLLLAYCDFSGAVQSCSETQAPVMTICDLQGLSMILGGNLSKTRAFKGGIFVTLQRYQDGDQTMIVEIEHNKGIGKRKNLNNLLKLSKLLKPHTDVLYRYCD